jgi:hypothetical protein
METEPLDYASSRGTQPKRRRTSFGGISLLLIAALWLLFIEPRIRWRLALGLQGEFTLFVYFDRVLFDILVTALAVAGIKQGGWSRWMGVVALLITWVPFCIAILSSL